jgi:hypothetical protein
VTADERANLRRLRALRGTATGLAAVGRAWPAAVPVHLVNEVSGQAWSPKRGGRCVVAWEDGGLRVAVVGRGHTLMDAETPWLAVPLRRPACARRAIAAAWAAVCELARDERSKTT